MKKIFAIVSLVVLSACGGNGASTEVTTDSSTVVVDSIKVDSTVVPVDSTKVDEAPKVEEVK
jgi:hypothetical protein